MLQLSKESGLIYLRRSIFAIFCKTTLLLWLLLNLSALSPWVMVMAPAQFITLTPLEDARSNSVDGWLAIHPADSLIHQPRLGGDSDSCRNSLQVMQSLDGHDCRLCAELIHHVFLPVDEVMDSIVSATTLELESEFGAKVSGEFKFNGLSSSLVKRLLDGLLRPFGFKRRPILFLPK